MDSRIEKVIEIIKRVKPQMDIVDENTILNEGVLDSLDVIAVVGLLEKEFQIKMIGNCFKKENFETPVTLLKMIDKIGV